MHYWRAIALAVWILCFTMPAVAYQGHLVVEGPITLALGGIPTVTELAAVQRVGVTLTNSGAAEIRVRLKLSGLVDPCRARGGGEREITVPAHGFAESEFQFTVGAGAFQAAYPVHVLAEWDGGGRKAHAIRIFEVAPAGKAATAPVASVIEVPSTGGSPLAGVSPWRAAWGLAGKELHALPPGWEGSDPESLAFFQRNEMARGQTRQCLNVHPPYKTGTGPLFLEYRIHLPKGLPSVFRFYNAIRDVFPPEPPSDGVTFRVWVGDEKVFERHTASTVWMPGEADLSRWAGQTVSLRLETHPGPKLDPTCDSSYWGDPVVLAGKPPVVLGEGAVAANIGRAREAVLSGRESTGIHLLALADGMRAAVVPGPNGLADSVVAFGSGKGAVAMRGFTIALEGQNFGGWESGIQLEKLDVERKGDRLVLRHRLRLQRMFRKDGRPVPTETASVLLTATFRVDGPGLRLAVESDARLTDLAIGPADAEADRVYYGHGYVIEKPGRFRANGGGHDLSTSHVGCDFPGGVSLLQACDTPPDFLLVDPGERIYSLHTHPDATLTFLPGHGNAIDCALKYRALYDKKPAPAVARKAGRFVFDIWAGTYADDERLLRRCFDYGLTNSMVLMHAWQRWGYDDRLPDVFPPMPQLGSVETMRHLGETCTGAGVLWGLHENYIDFYPDAEGFSYDAITFDPRGQPDKGWLNEWAEAQAYKFRPDRFQPYLNRNLGLIAPALKPTASFVDVWTSMNAFDYHDREGRWHSKMETLRCWGQAFDDIRRAFAGGPTTSEAGSDQLIGHLDGADCQLMRLTPDVGRFGNRVPCADWEEVPWFDAVNHTRFSLHGVGYSDRYQGGRSRENHGIESDDYLSAEMLTGHALMIDHPAMIRGAVRKYWLAQPIAEKLARDEIASIRHFEGDLHRISVNWVSGAAVHVNRGSNDWVVGGHVLPQFGYHAQAGAVESSVERMSGETVERSVAGNILYANGRGFRPETVAASPVVERVEPLGGRNFRLILRWHAAQAAQKDLCIFEHFNRSTLGRYKDTEFFGGGYPELPTSQWSGDVVTGTNWTVHIPEGYPAGDYDILCGMYDAKAGGTRYRLVGDERDGRRYLLGVLHVEESGGGAGDPVRISFIKPSRPAAVAEVPRAAARVDFGWVETTGGLRAIRARDHLLIVPLPDQDPFELALNLSRCAGPRATQRGLSAVAADGKILRPVPCREEGGTVRFSTERGDFGYRLELGGD